MKISLTQALEALPPRWTLPDYRIYFRQLWRRHGWRALVKQCRFQFRRPFSRSLIKRYAQGTGVEIGVGAYTLAPVSRTLLSDAHRDHAGDQSLATHFFPAEQIPFPDQSFDFVLSEHVLEHLGNPLGALREWMRVLKPNGTILLFLPHSGRTFDSDRKRTPLAHLIEDEKNKTPNHDTTHLSEWKEKVIDTGKAQHYALTPINEHPLRGLIHHHVWVPADLAEMAQYLGLQVLESHELCPDRQDSFVVVLKKGGNNP